MRTRKNINSKHLGTKVHGDNSVVKSIELIPVLIRTSNTVSAVVEHESVSNLRVFNKPLDRSQNVRLVRDGVAVYERVSCRRPFGKNLNENKTRGRL
jgi:hypothetical protein